MVPVPELSSAAMLLSGFWAPLFWLEPPAAASAGPDL